MKLNLLSRCPNNQGILSFIALIFIWSGSATAEFIKIDGSSTVYPITEAVAEEFHNFAKGKNKVTVGISGTGGGFKKFCRGEIDISNASRPISKEEIKACKESKVEYYELPVAYDAIAVVVNKNNNWVSEITMDELKTIWSPDSEGKIMDWSQVNKKWPKHPLKLYGAGPDSGTFDYFTEAVNHKSKASRGDYTPSEDDNTLVQGVKSDKNALAYLPFAYFEENKADLKVLGVISPKNNKAVLPSKETVKNGQYVPLSRPIFIYVNAKSMEKPEIKSFTQFYLDRSAETSTKSPTPKAGSKLSASEQALLQRCPAESIEKVSLVCQVRYVPLPTKAYELAKHRMDNKILGSVFGGEAQIGLRIEDLLKKESIKK